MIRSRLLAVAIGLILNTFPAAAQESSPHRPSLHEGTLTLRAGAYEVTFIESAAWTIGTVKFHNDPLIVRTGANQSVVNMKVAVQSGPNQWIGTAHGGEVVQSVALRVDGESYPPEKFEAAPAGRSYQLVKESKLGPFRCHTEVTIDPSGLTQSVSFKAEEEATLARYLYVFMHCWSPTLSEWLAILPDGSLLEERFPDEKETHLKSDLKTLALYNQERGYGVILNYDQPYSGEPGHGNFLINWPGRHHKHYFRISAQEANAKTYVCRIEGFTGNKEAWRERARSSQSSTH